MSDDEAIQFCIENAAGSARSMPLKDARLFLRGFLLLMEGRAEVEGVSEIYTGLALADEKLGEIASGQLRLPLGDGSQSGETDAQS